MKRLLILLLLPVCTAAQTKVTKLIYRNIDGKHEDTLFKMMTTSPEEVLVTSYSGKAGKVLTESKDSFLVHKQEWKKIVDGVPGFYLSRSDFDHPVRVVFVNAPAKYPYPVSVKYVPQRIFNVNGYEIWHYEATDLIGGARASFEYDVYFSPVLGMVKERVNNSVLMLEEFIPYKKQFE